MGSTPDLASYDVILLNTSGGKDSQVMIEKVYNLAVAAGVEDRLVAVHADLGIVEWEGTRELAEEQVAHYGIRFEVVSRPQGDLLDHVMDRGMWPSSTTRYCTSDHKRGQVAKVMTMLSREVAATITEKRQARILSCMGFRAEESPARAKREPFTFDERASTKTTRHVDVWLPIHEMTEVEVWASIKAGDVRHHPAYDAGMPRLSCSFCILSSKSALVRAAQLRPELAQDYLAVEELIDHRFTMHLSMAEIIEEAEKGIAVEITNWAA